VVAWCRVLYGSRTRDLPNTGPLSTNYSSIQSTILIFCPTNHVRTGLKVTNYNVGTGVFDLAFLRGHTWRRSLSEVVLRSVMPSFCSLDPVQRCSDFAALLSWSSTEAAALPNSHPWSIVRAVRYHKLRTLSARKVTIHICAIEPP